jgi:threonine/homoserine/homoserine lactone efflux protein
MIAQVPALANFVGICGAILLIYIVFTAVR